MIYYFYFNEVAFSLVSQNLGFRNKKLRNLTMVRVVLRLMKVI